MPHHFTRIKSRPKLRKLRGIISKDVNKDVIKNCTCTFHAEQQKHGDDCQECSHCVSDNVFQGIIIWNEQNMEHRGGWQVTGQKAAGVGQNGTGFNHRQAEKGDSPYAVKSLQKKIQYELFSRQNGEM